MMTYDELVQLVESQAKIIKALEQRIVVLEAELAKYKNSNTPPSANRHLKSSTQWARSKKGSKRGARKGHAGKTRTQNVTRTEDIDANCCPHCKSKKVKDKKVYKRVVEEIKEPIEPEITEYTIHKKECQDCGKIFIPPNNHVPLEGKFGINVMVLVVFMKYLLRGVLRKIVRFLDIGYSLNLTPASVGAILKRVSLAAESEYESLKERIRSAARVFVDETSFSVLGKNYWCWVFRTAEDVLLVIRPSRGRDVLLEILGEHFSGIVTCDCWRAYDYLKYLQRCWSHLLRKAKDECETLYGKHLYAKLKVLFQEIKKFNMHIHSSAAREKKYHEMTTQLRLLVQYYSQYESLHKVIEYLGNNLENWFTCVRYENVEPTNNFAEQSIRETVIVRKIIGAFRSEEGSQYYTTLASLIATWQIRGSDIKNEIKKMLKEKLCFC